MMRLIATFFGTGDLRPAPGTWGSLAALPAAWALFQLIGAWGVICATLAVFVLGWWATHQVTKNGGDHDPSFVVIDEVVGQWIALWPVLLGAWHTGADVLALWPGWIVAFIGFRAFDITKPGPIGWADRRGDSLGVMLDDVIAGLFAAVAVVGLAVLAHGVIMVR